MFKKIENRVLKFGMGSKLYSKEKRFLILIILL